MNSTCKDCKHWRDVLIPGYGIPGQCTKWKTDDGAFMYSSYNGYCLLLEPTSEHLVKLRQWWKIAVGKWPEWKRALVSEALNEKGKG